MQINYTTNLGPSKNHVKECTGQNHVKECKRMY